MQANLIFGSTDIICVFHLCVFERGHVIDGTVILFEISSTELLISSTSQHLLYGTVQQS
jgi:hypothetical protein